MRSPLGLGAIIAAGLLSAQDGSSLYDRTCASCHNGGNDRAPSRDALRSMSADRVLAAMETGPMISMAVRLTTADRRAIAEFVSGKPIGQPLVTTPSAKAMCPASEASFTLAGSMWTGWGVNTSNTRFQSTAGIGAAEVPRLKVKWAFAFPGDIQAYSQPTIAGGRVFVGSAGGKVYSLEAKTGCVHWFFEADSGVRSAVTLARVGSGNVAFFGDGKANVYGVDATTGKQLWKTKADAFPVAGITSSPVFYNGRIYIGVKSGEEASGADPHYECCRFRGSVVALDAATGKQVWKTYLVDEPKRTTKNKAGAQLWAPSGVSVWSTPAIDGQRNAVYVTTGNNYTDPATRMSDAFVALDLNSGKILWSRQMTPKDAYTAACRLPDKTNCAESNGPDFDFGSSPILVALPSGKRALIAGQKSGVVYAVDPDNQGEVLWQTRVGKGGTMGGVQWGSAADQNNVYVAVSDIGRIMLTYSTSTDADPKQGGGMFALRLNNGENVWYTAPKPCGQQPRCSPAQSAAVTAIPGVAFSGSVDGHLRAYSSADGKIVWDYDTAQAYETVNGVPGHGGSLDGPGPAIADGMLFVNSGYPTAGGMSGNVLLAFSVDGN
ncbi:MAG: PQQ-binding-like beta-propeller repeat protein [Acidobacteriia bacterium]|nr:PQQ-binding-like beta-propeller repeat protein [Terriglobia bacterium]